MKIGFLNALTLIFVISKLAGWVQWSWWLVFTPTFVAVFIWLTLFMLMVIAQMLD